MYSYLLSVIPPMLLGAQCVLLLILLKGNICPGQRGRIHKQLPIIAILWLAISPLFWPLASVSVLIFVFFSQVKVSKTRESGPIWLLQLALGFAIAFILFFIIGSERPQGLFILAGMMFLVQVLAMFYCYWHGLGYKLFIVCYLWLVLWPRCWLALQFCGRPSITV